MRAIRDTNAWAKMERSEVSLEGFVALFEAEARRRATSSTAGGCCKR